MSVAWLADEAPDHHAAIAALTTAAFAAAPHSGGNEADIIARLRAEGDLAVSLVALGGSGIDGHIAFSKVTISDGSPDWYGLGPVSVDPASRRRGIGGALVRSGLTRLKELGARGCVVLGDPGYYGRFGFVSDPALAYPGPPAEYFQRLLLAGPPAMGRVRYARAFG